MIDGILLAEAGRPREAAVAARAALDLARSVSEWMGQRALMYAAFVLERCACAPLAAALLPQLRSAEATPEKAIYLPPLEQRLAGVQPEEPPIGDRAAAIRRVRAALDDLSQAGPG